MNYLFLAFNVLFLIIVLYNFLFIKFIRIDSLTCVT